MNLDFSGVWKANLEKSNLPGARPKAVLVKIDHSDPELLVEMVIAKTNETEDRLIFRGLTSEDEVTNLVGGVQVRSRSRWMGADLLIESWMNLGGREGHFRDSHVTVECSKWSIEMTIWQVKSRCWKE